MADVTPRHRHTYLRIIGLIFVLLVMVGAILLLRKYRILTSRPTRQNTSNLVKAICPRCENDPIEKTTCEKCGRTGLIWVDPSKYDTPELHLLAE